MSPKPPAAGSTPEAMDLSAADRYLTADPGPMPSWARNAKFKWRVERFDPRNEKETDQ